MKGEMGSGCRTNGAKRNAYVISGMARRYETTSETKTQVAA
jgi:hypothetical protein